jgi:hypothetical protein
LNQFISLPVNFRVADFRAIGYAYCALYACADRAYKRAVSLLKLGDRHISAIRSPQEKGRMLLIKAILRRHCDREDTRCELDVYLDATVAEYVRKSQLFLQDHCSLFEAELYKKYYEKDIIGEDILDKL